MTKHKALRILFIIFFQTNILSAAEPANMKAGLWEIYFKSTEPKHENRSTRACYSIEDIQKNEMLAIVDGPQNGKINYNNTVFDGVLEYDVIGSVQIHGIYLGECQKGVDSIVPIISKIDENKKLDFVEVQKIQNTWIYYTRKQSNGDYEGALEYIYEGKVHGFRLAILDHEKEIKNMMIKEHSNFEKLHIIGIENNLAIAQKPSIEKKGLPMLPIVFIRTINGWKLYENFL